MFHIKSAEEKRSALETMSSKTEQDSVEVARGDLIVLNEVDPALAAKMHLVNQAINQVGFTPYHMKLFFLNGFGYAVDSMVAFCMSIANSQVVLEYQPSYNRGGQMGLYIGLLIGALFWGISADIIGRKWAFNLTLLVSSVFAIIAGAAPNYASWAAFVAISAFGAGGNLVLDTTVFLEYLPQKNQWLVTLMAVWWGVGQTVVGLVAWAFMPNFSCVSADDCPRSSNMGWRYLYFTVGALVLTMSLARVLVIRFHETPKYLLCIGEDEKVVNLLQSLATKHGKNCDLSLSSLEALGQVMTTHSTKSKFSLNEVLIHYKGLFSTRILGWSTVLVWLSWTLIGLAYPLFYVFLPDYLATRGAEFGQTSAYVTWRNYVIAQVCSIGGPIVAAFLTKIDFIGRKYTMAIGALISMAFFFAYTAVRNDTQNLGFNCAISFAINIYYGTLYAYSPEVLPSAHRATGNGTAVAFNRIMGILSAVIATYADTSTSAPIFVCAALFIAMAIVAVLFPLEPQKAQSG